MTAPSEGDPREQQRDRRLPASASASPSAGAPFFRSGPFPSWATLTEPKATSLMLAQSPCHQSTCSIPQPLEASVSPLCYGCVVMLGPQRSPGSCPTCPSPWKLSSPLKLQLRCHFREASYHCRCRSLPLHSSAFELSNIQLEISCVTPAWELSLSLSRL